MAATGKNYDSLIKKLTGTGAPRPTSQDKITAEDLKGYKKALSDFKLDESRISDIPLADRVTMAEFCRIWGKADAVARYHIKKNTGLITIIGVDQKPPHHLILSRTEAESILARQTAVDNGGLDVILRMSHDARPDVEKNRFYISLPMTKEEFRDGKIALSREGKSLDQLVHSVLMEALGSNQDAKSKKKKKVTR